MPKVMAATVVERRAREARLREEHILAVVKSLIRQGGAAEVSIRRVAEQAGFSTTVVYAHFKDKATLITRALDADLLALVAAMRTAVQGVDDTAERLQRAGLAYVAYGLAHTDEYQLVFMEPRPHAPVDAAQVEHGNAEQDPYAFAFGLVEAFARKRLGFGGQGAELTAHQVQTVHLMTQMYWQSLHGLVSLNIVMGPTDPWAPHIDPSANAATAMEVLLAGFEQRFRARTSGQ
ncbi:TetR/AcrR family transcriptional regulator [Curvibacter sp. APW13]|uniref:TetR/AcrR family transcriptional regulator n=1 Tax=Curvibacter sp. APW13 TaxID=3077236 RepID=UPI0028DED521|nr:TetR/AcrR family transcriptional regulator [Curvibacter sp. APW13]MDT8991475.1 TetR/AcrR family transcriptional regulator [Curvibacter sp. APW13]